MSWDFRINTQHQWRDVQRLEMSSCFSSYDTWQLQCNKNCFSGSNFFAPRPAAATYQHRKIHCWVKYEMNDCIQAILNHARGALARKIRLQSCLLKGLDHTMTKLYESQSLPWFSRYHHGRMPVEARLRPSIGSRIGIMTFFTDLLLYVTEKLKIDTDIVERRRGRSLNC